jgi:beta-galactosidase
MTRTLGVCYYPEHWPEAIWPEDARRMVDTGLTWVRIGEFSWSRLEPSPGDLRFDWLDRAIEVLGAAGLKVVLGTPTATPPRWMLDRHPDMLALGADGQPRKFGSRRHYCFSHQGYRRECARIVTLLAERYGRNPHVAAWQTDNEYGCHDTTISYSDAARQAFRHWLRGRYPGAGNDGDIEALNAAWGNVFWSMEYGDFDQIDLPNLTVTQPNPAHELDFRRFSSDQVVSFNRAQVEIIRQHSDAPIAHNYMGRTTDFDHYAVGADLEIASWDSYPLGFLEDRVQAPADYKQRFARQGDPDFQAFHHDLYRAVGRGRWWVMEQQPGPVNWAPYNPAPLPGMVRLWTWEAFAHGAEAVCYFRWRQAPMAQEQMHAGLLRPDSAAAPALAEAAQVAAELAEAPALAPMQAPVALIFDYRAHWMWEVLPQGRGLSYFDLVFDSYRALRSLGLSVDIVPPLGDLDGYRVIVAPGLMHLPDALKDRLVQAQAQVVLGPRSGSSTAGHGLAVPLGPDIPGLDVTVGRVETLRPDMSEPLKGGGAIQGWREVLDGSAKVLRQTQAGAPAVVGNDRVTYVGGWLDGAALKDLLAEVCRAAGLAPLNLPEALRRRETANEVFWFNHGTTEIRALGQRFPPLSVTRIEKGAAE